ncbi:MAG: SDR family NAD(P)-dependent oxidoreductase, partial [Nocardioidaceae bacterium]
MSLSPAIARGLDRLLDRSVVLGYTRIGPALRRAWWPADPPPDALRGKAVAVTGANSGLGKATALGAARLGADVWMLCRSQTRAEAARQDILASVPGANVRVLTCDVSDLSSIPDVAERLIERVPKLHALVHNAGVMPPERTESRQGHELCLATHVLG